jgi:archaetidylinositol phosphate synthase
MGDRPSLEQREVGEESPTATPCARPWDARLARALVAPLRHTRVHPNHVTTLGLVVGLAAAACYASGRWANWGGLLFVAAAVLDHADGELARLTGKTSAFGHTYDRIADLCVKLALFSGMGMGLRHSALGDWASVFGLTAGVALIAIFLLRGEIARRRGVGSLDQPSAAGFEIEDILYGVAPVTWCGWLLPFVVAAGIGAPLFALWTARQFLASRTVDVPGSSACPS